MLEALARFARRLGCARIALQDASYLPCPARRGLRQRDADLSLRSLLQHGRTWYERLGFRMDPEQGQGPPPSRAGVAAGITAFKRLRLDRAVRQLERQSARLLSPGARVEWAAASAGPVAARVATLARAVSERAWLLRRLRQQPPDASLAGALLAMPCADYARALDTLYGDRYGCRFAPCVSLRAVDGIGTPGWAAFRRADALHRNTYRITWVRDT